MGDIRLSGAGDIIRAMRTEAGITLEGLAQAISCNKVTLSRYENDDTNISLELIERIGKALGRSPEEIVLRCIKQRYPNLDSSRTKVGSLAAQLIDYIESM